MLLAGSAANCLTLRTPSARSRRTAVGSMPSAATRQARQRFRGVAGRHHAHAGGACRAGGDLGHELADGDPEHRLEPGGLGDRRPNGAAKRSGRAVATLESGGVQIGQAGGGLLDEGAEGIQQLQHRLEGLLGGGAIQRQQRFGGPARLGLAQPHAGRHALGLQVGTARDQRLAVRLGVVDGAGRLSFRWLRARGRRQREAWNPDTDDQRGTHGILAGRGAG